MLWDFGSIFLLSTHSSVFFLVSFPMDVVLLIISAMQSAVILGILKSPENETGIWPVALSSIRNYTWPLIRLALLLMLAVWVFVIPISMVVAFSGKTLISPHNYVFHVLFVFLAILYLAFIKFALAEPLIVVENMRAIDSLKKSWEMTKGRFGYVFGCYVFLGTAEYFAQQLLDHFASSASFGVVNLINHIINGLVGCLWVLMAWCMYWRIKGHEAQSTSFEVPNLSAPASPSAP